MVLITGSNSLLGRAIVDLFREHGEKIRCYDQYRSEQLPDGVEFIQGDLFSAKRLTAACKDVTAIIHLQDKSRTKTTSRGRMKKININGTRNLLFMARKAKIKRIIFLSTYAVYGKTKSFPTREEDVKKPYTPYGKDKLKAEKLCEAFAKKNKMDLTIMRPALIAAPGLKDSAVLITLYMAMGLGNDNIMFMSGNGDNRFQLLSPRDAAEAFYLTYKAEEKTSGMTFNIGSDNVPTQMEQIVKIKEQKKLDFTVKHITRKKALWYSIMFKLSRLNYFTREHKMFIFNNVYMDCQKLKIATGWKPEKTNMDIISDTVDWYKGKLK
ncbi:MAG: NAD(P)-dependent oxidoreductase [Spirochaetes bacterium]|nr:NAD(P)-dependent oxidoreductase [Spirochaetota bacterium]